MQGHKSVINCINSLILKVAHLTLTSGGFSGSQKSGPFPPVPQYSSLTTSRTVNLETQQSRESVLIV